MGSSRPRDWTWVFCIIWWILYCWAAWVALDMCVSFSQYVCGVSFSCPLVYIPMLHQCHTIFITMTSFVNARPTILFSFFKTTWLHLVMGFSTSIFPVYLEPSKFYEIPLGCSESRDHFLEKWHCKNIFSSKHEHEISFFLNPLCLLIKFYNFHHIFSLGLYLLIWQFSCFKIFFIFDFLTVLPCI